MYPSRLRITDASLKQHAHPQPSPLSRLRDSSPSKGEQNFLARPHNVYSSTMARFRAKLLRYVPPPLWGGGQGEGPFNHQRHRPRRRCSHRPNHPLSPPDSPPLKGEQMFDSARAVACGVAAEPLRRLLHEVPPPLWGGGQGEGPNHHPTPIQTPSRFCGQRWLLQTPPQSSGQLPLQGGAKFLGLHGKDILQRLRQSPNPAFFPDSPLPFGEGDRGRGPFLPADSAAVLSLNATLPPTDTPSVLRTAPPPRGSKTF